jgi:hypothetical protein
VPAHGSRENRARSAATTPRVNPRQSRASIGAGTTRANRARGAQPRAEARQTFAQSRGPAHAVADDNNQQQSIVARRARARAFAQSVSIASRERQRRRAAICALLLENAATGTSVHDWKRPLHSLRPRALRRKLDRNNNQKSRFLS